MIIVKSIKEKPEECRGCKLLDESTYDCLINSESPAYTTLEGQYEHCPIEEHPDINVGNIDTTTHDSIPAETGENDGDKTSGDCISRTQAIDVLHGYFDGMLETDTVCPADIYGLFEYMPSAQPEVIRCKDCVYQTESWSGIKYCEAHGDHIGKDYDYCSNARRKENGQTDFTASCD